MALRYNVVDARRELSNKKKITPSEYYLLEEIELGTIGARNSKKMICSKAEFFLADLSKLLGYKTQMKIWALLKSLQAKDLIVREATRSKGREILGLNPDVFGQVLIDKSHLEERIRHLKLVPKPPVDKSEDGGDNSKTEQTNRMSETNESFANNTQNVCDSPTNRLHSEAQPVETTNEKPLLDPVRELDSSKGQIIKESDASKRVREESCAVIRDILKGTMRSMA